MRWPDSVVLGLTLYIALSWIAISTHGIPLKYVTWVFIGMLWALASARTRWLQTTLVTRIPTRPALGWLAAFCLLYVVAFTIVCPAAGPEFLPLGAGDNVALVTYARYARQLLDAGTAQVDLAAFGYARSPASMHLLAWQSLMFGRDPLQAALPTLLMLTALFGMIAGETATAVFRLTPGPSMAIACVAVCGPVLRWMLGASALGEVATAAVLLYVVRVVGRLVSDREFTLAAGTCLAAGTALLVGAAPPAGGWWSHLLGGAGGLLSSLSPLALIAWPGSIPSIANPTPGVRSAAVVAVVLVPVVWGALAGAMRRWRVLERPELSEADRRLAGALGVYAGGVLIFGNIAVQAFSGVETMRQPGAWRSLYAVSEQPFSAVTLKVDDASDGLSAALAMYYLPGRTAEVIGRGVSLQELPFDSISTRQPMFVHNFGCSGVGHDDVVPLQGVGCVLWAPPSAAMDVSYSFGQTFLFLSFDRMTPREPGGRWNTRPTVELRMMADPARVALDRELFVNLLVDPLLPAGPSPQSLTATWGAGRRGGIAVDRRQWFSLPVRNGDWKGNRVWSVSLQIDIPDKRRLLFQEMSLTAVPRGSVATPVAE